MNNCEKMELIELIDQAAFMIDDITLYLDTHPECQRGIAAYNNYKTIRHDAIKEYTERFGPINRYNVNADNYFNWIDGPWPWEGVCDC